MTPKSKNILVGIFVIFFSLGAIACITWLGSTAVREETDTYIAYLDESVSGLSQNSPVKYKGVTIGQVKKIQINPNNSNQVELQLIIKRGTPIKVDSELILTSQGITGLQYIASPQHNHSLSHFKNALQLMSHNDKRDPQSPIQL